MPKRNKFSRSHYNLLTMNMGEMIPIYWDEVIPGDIWQQRTSCLIRVSPQVKPTMHPCRVRIAHWYVPTRLIFDDYEDFFTGGNDGDTLVTHPYINTPSTVTEGSLYDYLGMHPAAYGSAQAINALPFRAYAKIWNEHYRDQDLQTELDLSTASNLDITTNTSIRSVNWEKDRFTTARTDTQRGSDITIPLTGDALITKKTGTGNVGHLYETDDTQHATGQGLKSSTGGWLRGDDGTNLYYDPNGTLQAETSSISGVTLEDLRLALGKQRYMEIMQRAGARYGEYSRAIFGVNNPDHRLQIPEYLGGGRQTISFSEILSTADTGSYDVGDMVGHGIATMRTRRYRRFIPEHGIIMSVMCVVPRAIYTQSVDRQLWRNNNTVKEDYFVPQLQGIGDDEIYNKEVYGEHTTPDGVFGYQSRYDEYRTKESRVSGEMRSTPGYNWHLGRVLSTSPSLNSSFITCAPSKRILADQVSDSLQVMASHSIQTRRPIGKTGMPTKI